MPIVFAYGSLLNAASRRATLGADVPWSRACVRPSWGYKRAFNVRGEGETEEVYLGLAPSSPGQCVPGVLLHVTPAELARLCRRERYYRPVRVPHDALDPPTHGVVTFYPLARHTLAVPRAPSRRYRRLVQHGHREVCGV